MKDGSGCCHAARESSTDGPRQQLEGRERHATGALNEVTRRESAEAC